jgi:hypothetical protein
MRTFKEFQEQADPQLEAEKKKEEVIKKLLAQYGINPKPENIREMVQATDAVVGRIRRRQERHRHWLGLQKPSAADK